MSGDKIAENFHVAGKIEAKEGITRFLESSNPDDFLKVVKEII